MGLIGLLVGGAMDAHKAIKQNQAQGDEEMHHVTVDNRFSIDVPAFLDERHDLSEEASVQYASRTLGISFQVVEEPKDEFIASLKKVEAEYSFEPDKTLLDKMAVMKLDNYFEDIDKVQFYDYTNTTINGLNAVTFSGFQKRTFFDDARYGSIALIEGKNTLYQIIIMTSGTSISKLAEKMAESIKSFREL